MKLLSRIASDYLKIPRRFLTLQSLQNNRKIEVAAGCNPDQSINELTKDFDSSWQKNLTFV